MHRIPTHYHSGTHTLSTFAGTGFGPRLNTQKLPNETYVDHQKKNPQSHWNKFAIAVGSSRLEAIRLWKQKGCIFKCFLLHTRTNAECDVCLVLLIYFAGICNSEYALSRGTMHA